VLAVQPPNILLLIATFRDLPFKTDTKLSAQNGRFKISQWFKFCTPIDPIRKPVSSHLNPIFMILSSCSFLYCAYPVAYDGQTQQDGRPVINP
jgi:hypothetical protein